MKKEHWSETKSGQNRLLNLINERFYFTAEGKMIKKNEYCQQCKNENVACTCKE